jgi:hypothetical protein
MGNEAEFYLLESIRLPILIHLSTQSLCLLLLQSWIMINGFVKLQDKNGRKSFVCCSFVFVSPPASLPSSATETNKTVLFLLKTWKHWWLLKLFIISNVEVFHWVFLQKPFFGELWIDALWELEIVWCACPPPENLLKLDTRSWCCERKVKVSFLLQFTSLYGEIFLEWKMCSDVHSVLVEILF